MACPLPCRKAPDGTKVLIIVPDVVTDPRKYYVAATMAPWTGDPTELTTCEEPVCDPVSESFPITDFVLETCVETTVAYDLEATVLGRGNQGYQYTTAVGNSNVPAVFDIPIPASAAGRLMFLHVISGGDTDFATRDTNTMNEPALAAPTGTLVNGSKISSFNANWDFDHVVYAYEVSGNGSSDTVQVSFPNNTQGGADPLNGVINWHWVEVKRSDDGELDLSVIDSTALASFIGTGPVTANDPVTFYDFSNEEDCQALVLTGGRHAIDAGVADLNEISDSEFAVYQATTGSADRLYSTSSMDLIVVDTQCQLGMGAAFLDAQTDVDIVLTHNNNSGSGLTERNSTFAIPLLCERLECVATDPRDPDLFSVPSPDCDREFSKTVTADVEFTIPAGGSVTLVPILDGTDLSSEAVTVAASGVQQISIAVPMGTVSSGQSADCSLNWELRDANGLSAGSQAAITGMSVTFNGA